MSTKRERLKYLAARMDSLSKEIQDSKREDEYLALAQEIAEGRKNPRAIDEDVWNLMLPKEQQINLLLHYHTLRAEAFALTDELKKSMTMEKLKDVLDSPYVKGPIAIAALVKVAAAVVALGGSLGLFFRDEDQDKKFFV